MKDVSQQVRLRGTAGLKSKSRRGAGGCVDPAKPTSRDVFMIAPAQACTRCGCGYGHKDPLRKCSTCRAGECRFCGKGAA